MKKLLVLSADQRLRRTL